MHHSEQKKLFLFLQYIRCSKTSYGCYNVTEPPIDAPRDPMYKTEREVLKEYDDDNSFWDPNVDSKFEKMAGFLSLSLGFTLKSNDWAGLEQVPCTNNESEVATKKIKTKKGVHDLDFTKSLDKEMPDIFAPTKNPKLLC